MQPTGLKLSAEPYARKALNEDAIEMGVKGPMWLMKLHNYDIIRGTGIDYMHCTLLGEANQASFNNPLVESQIISNTLKHQNYDRFYDIIRYLFCLAFYH